MFQKGQSGNPSGRPQGAKNKKTENIRAMLLDFTIENQYELQEWLNRVAKDDPAKAYDLWLKTLNYILPKLSQEDITTMGEKINIVLPPKIVNNKD